MKCVRSLFICLPILFGCNDSDTSTNSEKSTSSAPRQDQLNEPTFDDTRSQYETDNMKYHEFAKQMTNVQRDMPPPVAMFKENELREIMSILDRLPTYGGWRYDPLRMIQAVNTLQPLGKKKALAAISEYLRVTPFPRKSREGMFLLLRILFEARGSRGNKPGMYIGTPMPPDSSDPKLIPRFPVVLEGDIPFCLVEQYLLVGSPQLVEDHVEYFRKHGTMRARPLLPTNVPFETLQKLTKSPIKHYLDNRMDGGKGRYMLTNQLLWLARSVYRTDADGWGRRFDPGQGAEERFEHLEKEFSKIKIRWNHQMNMYTFEDGSFLKKPSYRRIVWEPEIRGIEPALIIERKSRSSIFITLNCTIKDRSVLPATILIYSTENAKEVIAEFFIREPTLRSGQVVYTGTSSHADLIEGESVHATLSSKDGSIRSVTWVP